MSNYFNDSPIESPSDDRYGITPFAAALTRSIIGIKDPVGTTLALSGPWGSGKSSAVNLIRGELAKAGTGAPVVTDFKCWWYRGEEALALAFLQNLNAVLRDSLGDKVKDLIPSLTRGLLQAGPVVGQAMTLAKEGDADRRNDARFEPFLSDVSPSHRETAKVALQRLFPRLEGIGYSGDFARHWDMERRVCIDSHFDTYFRLSLSNDALSATVINAVIARADDGAFVQATMREAARTVRRNGQTLVPVYLEELTTHASRIPLEKIGALFSSLFAIHDEIDLERDADKGFMGIATTTYRFHWLIRALTRDRCNIDQRTGLYLPASSHAALGWLVDFTHSAISDYQPREGRETREEDRLVTEVALSALKELALVRIRAAAADGSLLRHRDLMPIIYSWRSFMGGDVSEVRAWTDQLMKNDAALAVLARAMTGQSWSFGMGGFGGLGDRVATPRTEAHIRTDTDILDVPTFRGALERVLTENRLEEGDREAIRVFLAAWDRGDRRGGNDD